MIVSMIAAMGKNHVIGRDNQMMWHLPLEYKYFKETTLGHCIITGRKNYEAIGRPLPGRTNIIVTRQEGLKLEGCVVVNSIEQALEYASKQGESEAFITGGGQIYESSMELVDKIYLTVVDYFEEGDVYFPSFDQNKFNKKLIHSEPVGEKNSLEWSAYLYTKNE
jgi:dihydrofolate reductase